MGAWMIMAMLGGVVGCATTQEIAEHEASGEHDEPDEHGHHSPLPSVSPELAARVVVLEAESAGQPSEVLGIIDVHAASGQQDRALGELRIRAAALGADAVTGVEFHHGDHGGETTHLSGTAVRFRDLIQGRTYDVIADLDVRAEMGHEEEALRSLRARARAVNADLIIGVSFEHGEGGDGPLRLTGKAIQFRVGQGGTMGAP
jgi:uncharacterized protein YbjQ (UPF0145 family)